MKETKEDQVVNLGEGGVTNGNKSQEGMFGQASDKLLTISKNYSCVGLPGERINVF